MLARERSETRIGTHDVLKIAVKLVGETRNIRGFFYANFGLREGRRNEQRRCKQRNDETRLHKTSSRKFDSPSAHEAAVSEIEGWSLRGRLSPSGFGCGCCFDLRSEKRKAAKCGLLCALEGIYSAATA